MIKPRLASGPNRAQPGCAVCGVVYHQTMESEHYKQAKSYIDRLGYDQGLWEIQRNVADVRRGGDPEIIDYWRAVLKAAEGMSG